MSELLFTPTPIPWPLSLSRLLRRHTPITATSPRGSLARSMRYGSNVLGPAVDAAGGDPSAEANGGGTCSQVEASAGDSGDFTSDTGGE